MGVQTSTTPRAGRASGKTAQPKSRRPVPPALIDQDARRSLIAQALP